MIFIVVASKIFISNKSNIIIAGGRPQYNNSNWFTNIGIRGIRSLVAQSAEFLQNLINSLI